MLTAPLPTPAAPLPTLFELARLARYRRTATPAAELFATLAALPVSRASGTGAARLAQVLGDWADAWERCFDQPHGPALREVADTELDTLQAAAERLGQLAHRP
jgi:hypothetical protein